MTASSLRTWAGIHKWSSLVCTIFLLMLCVTGLPLIFHDEIDALAGDEDGRPVIDAAAERADMLPLDEMIAKALAANPGHVPLFLSFDEERPVVNVTTGPTPDAAGIDMQIRSYDRLTGELAGIIAEDGVMDVILQIHTDMFLGLPGMLFLGAMGALFIVALVSGVVLYAPIMRKMDFGTVRASRPTRIRWLDYHNLLGITALAWAAVVGLTGIIHTLATPIVDYWRGDQLAELTAAYAEAEPLPASRYGSVDTALRTVRAVRPGSRPQFIAFPGGSYSSAHHYTIFLQGGTPLTKGILTPAVVDAETGALTDVRPMPWYMKALQISRPLHFGDYGGLPLKIVWAALDLFTIVILGSGVYLWIAGRRPQARPLLQAETANESLVAAE